VEKENKDKCDLINKQDLVDTGPISLNDDAECMVFFQIGDSILLFDPYFLCNLDEQHVTTPSVEMVPFDDMDNDSCIFDDVINEIEANQKETGSILSSKLDNSRYFLYMILSHIDIFLFHRSRHY
jgi:hypothetical protein